MCYSQFSNHTSKMIFELLIFFSQARKEICICNNNCSSLCPANYFNASSNSNFQEFIIPHIKDEKEINLYLYSQTIGFTFSIDLSYFQSQRLTIKSLTDSKEILLYIQKEVNEKYTETTIKPGYEIHLPDLIAIPYYNNKIKKIISSSNEPSSTTIPVSLGLHQLNHEGNAGCDNAPQNSRRTNYQLSSLSPSTDSRCNCPANEDELDKPSAYKCGFRCWGTATYDYVFKGVQFAIYGTKDNAQATCYVKIDDNPPELVDLTYIKDQSLRIDYVIVYTSDILEYGYHTVKIYPDDKKSGDKKKYELNKFVYWPSITAKRLNCTNFTLNENGSANDEIWKTETDGIGGIRKIRGKNGAAIIKLQCTKFWVYGIMDNNEGNLNVYYNGKSDSSTTKSPDNKVRENVLIYESPEFDYSAITVTLKPSSGSLVIYCIFYEVPPTPTQTPTPVSVSLLDMECEHRDNCGSYSQGSDVVYNKSTFSDFGCSTNFNSPESYQCGIRCWGSHMTISYTFKGVKFGIFGKFDTNFGTFNVYLDGKNIASVYANAPTFTYANLFESNVYVYKEHTVTISSDGLYEIYKLVFWPSTKANRYNSSTFSYSPSYTFSSDSIGGIFHWYRYSQSYKYYQKSFQCSRFWVYHHSDRNYGNVTISFNDKSYSVSQETSARVRYNLVLDSDEFEYKSITLKGASNGYLTMSCVYYHTEPSELEYIDKNFYTTLPYIKVFVASNSRINQISGCNFSHIAEVLDYFIILQKDILFFDNTFEYSNSDDETYAMPIDIQYNSQGTNFLTIKNCTFIQATRKMRNSGANVFYCSRDYTINVNFESCLFENCGLSSSEIIIQIENQNSFLKMDNCTFQFTQNSCKTIKAACSRATICDCKFIKSGPIIIEQKDDDPSSTAASNNIAITQCTFDSCSISDYNYKAIQMIFTTISSITFEYNVISNIKTTENDDYSIFIDGNNKIEQLELKNITFINNSCSCLYGGGIGMIVHNINNLLFTCCDFINNEARKNGNRNVDIDIPGGDYYNGDGGAIQIGFYCLTNNASLTFNSCTFNKNKAARHGGALAIQTLSTVEINFCLFELNEANYDFGSTAELLIENHFNKKKQGRAGAIYINPSYIYNAKDHPDCKNTDEYLKRISITNSQFLTNSAFDGFAIYIEGDEVPTDFVIEKNVFNRNYNYDANSANTDPNLTVRGVIATEIHTISDVILEKNDFIIDNSKKFIFVDHYGSILSTNAFTESVKFSVSNAFSNSYKFSNSLAFSNSNQFSKSLEFSNSKDFTKSSEFSETKEFSATNDFSETTKFTNSLSFSNSNKFSKSFEFSNSGQFSETLYFSNTKDFTISSKFSETNKFTNSLAFSNSEKFIETDEFSHSKMFSNSEKFTETNNFSRTKEFSVTGEFSYSKEFSNSKQFSNSGKFTETNDFSRTEEFTITAKFSYSYIFSNSQKFSISKAFSNTEELSTTEFFTQTRKFSQSQSFTETEKFSNSNPFSGSKQFSHSLYFSQSQAFLPSDPLPYKTQCALYANDEYILINNCDYSQYESNKVLIRVITTNFTGYQKDGDGSAIRLINCGFIVNKTCFIDCISTSPVGGGGAIFINNSMDVEYNNTFIDILFLRCKAAYGGAVFIYSDSDICYCYFLRCQFLNNEAYAKKSVSNQNKNLFGGSAIYASSKNFNIENSTFYKNKGSAVKLHNAFNQMNSKHLLEKEENSFLIIGCDFDKDDKSKSAISYVDEKTGQNKLEIVNCNFKGKLKKDHHYIDGTILKKDSIYIESCNFEGDEKNAMKLDLFSDSSSLDLVNLNVVSNPFSSNFWKFVLVIAIFSSLFLLIILKISIYRNLECPDEKVLEL